MSLMGRLTTGAVDGRTVCYPSGPIRCARRELALWVLHRWLRESGAQPTIIQLTPSILVFAEVEWVAPQRLRGFSLQAFVVEGVTLEELASWEAERCISEIASIHTSLSVSYPLVAHYRFEAHERSLGKPFREPFVHVHRALKGEPRLPFPLAADDNPVSAFLELLALNYDYAAWEKWAGRVCVARGIEAEWDRVCAVYAHATGGAALSALLAEHEAALERVREALRVARNAPFPWTMASADRLALTYW